MTLVKFTFLICLLGLTIASTKAETAAIACHGTKWTEKCFENSSNGRRLKSRFLKYVEFQPNGFAVLNVNRGEFVGINKNGEVVIPGIVSGDFDYLKAEGGIAAFYAIQGPKGNRTSSKCGYFQTSNFKIVIPPVYTLCPRFRNQVAYVCKDCMLDCAECHNYEYYGGEAYVINANNQVLKRFALPKIPRCSTVQQRGGFPRNQPCRPNDEQP